MEDSRARSARGLRPIAGFLGRLPWWLLAILALGCAALFTALSSADYRVIFSAVARGMGVTVGVALLAYLLSLFLGLFLGLLRVSPLRPAREAASFYIELVRGLPMLVILYYIAFVGAPFFAQCLNALLYLPIRAGLMEPIQTREISFTVRAVLALTLGYAAFIAEIIRAGIQSVDHGQVEAARSLGLSRAQTTRLVVLPQGLRNVLPALANELVAIIKDSALVSVLGVQDITQLGKVYSASTFRFFETYNAVAFFYLCLTISLSLLARVLENRLKRGRQGTAET